MNSSLFALCLSFILCASACADSGDDTESQEPGIDYCSNLNELCASCDVPSNNAACQELADADDATACEMQYEAFLKACYPTSLACEELQLKCNDCTVENEKANCEAAANSRYATAELCTSFDITNYGSCPQP
ncbi:MAG: hypothetical protein IPJ88_15425 [Myxococcales bacterium]|nr:MAG: hypothetical protein IPJ88_15425 [Myxococcales bacterium]